MPLKVLVIGAGIAGLTAAVALRQAGHSVEIFEKSRFATEIGAAVALTPNGVQVLENIGFSFEKAKAGRLDVWETVDGTSLKRLNSLNFKNSEQDYGAGFYSVHRVDLHKELLRLAEEKSEKQPPVRLLLGSQVAKASVETGIVELEDGSKHGGDLIVAADGIHSVVRDAALPKRAQPNPAGSSAFRFLIPTGKVKQDPELEKLLEWKVPGVCILVDPTAGSKNRNIVWYDCHGGEVQNLVGIHPTRVSSDTEESAEDAQKSMLEEFGHYSPNLVKLIKLAEEVKCWPLFIYEPFDRWHYGKVILIGDAAHPMLPFGGQGSNQAIEDGGALGKLLQGVNDTSELSKRLDLFVQLRRNRASRTQALSKFRIGMEKAAEAELMLYIDNPGDAVPGSPPERVRHDFGYNVLGKCDELLARA